MSLHDSVKDNLNLLINEFPQCSTSKQKDKAYQKVTAILKRYHKPNSDAETREHFEGLEEKCRVLQNDELADALVERYTRLDQWQSKWKFDVLSFLLQLEDHPIEKTRLEDLDELLPVVLPSNLTWNELLRDDPFEDDAIWSSINYAESDSEDSHWSPSSDRDSSEEILSNVESTSDHATPHAVHDQSANEDFEAVLSAQKTYLENLQDAEITEAQLIRETISMLLGLPSLVYTERSKSIEMAIPIRICNVSDTVVNHLLQPICEIGTSLLYTRHALTRDHHDATSQSFQAAALKLLFSFEQHLFTQEYASIQRKEASSTLLSVIDSIRLEFRPLKLLEPLLHNALSLPSYRLLEELFYLVAQQQSLGDPLLYRTSAAVFIACLNTYLRPVKTWAEQGKFEEDLADFFVVKTTSEPLAKSLWQSNFSINLDRDGLVRAPSFLRRFVHKLFVAGKSMQLLVEIAPNQLPSQPETNPSVDITNIYDDEAVKMQPIEDKLDHVLEGWAKLSCKISETQVFDIVKQKSLLEETLLALQNVYLFSNGAIWQEIVETLLESMNNGKRWGDRFLLTDLLQERFTDVAGLNARRISVRVSKPSTATRSKWSVQELSKVRINYDISPATAIFLQRHHMEIFQSISVLLLQLKCAGTLLDRLFKLRTVPESATASGKLMFSLRRNLRWFKDTLFSYLTTTVISRAMEDLRHHVQTSKDIDELVTSFDNTILTLMESCMLSEQQASIQDTIISLLDLVVNFSDSCRVLSAVSFAGSDSITSTGSRNPTAKVHENDTPKIAPDHEETLRQQFKIFQQSLGFIVSKLQKVCQDLQHPLLQILLDNLMLGIGKG